MPEDQMPLEDARGVATRPDRPPAGLAPAEEPRNVFALIQMAMADDRVDAGKLRALLDIQAEQQAREAKREFAVALHAAQAKMPRVAKNGTIKLGEGKGAIPFSTWEDMDKVLRPIMEEHGFSLTFDTERGDGGLTVTIIGILLHVSGHSERRLFDLPKDTGPGRNAIQAIGSTFSYGRRYLAEMHFNIVRGGQDDDGDMGGRAYITKAQAEELDGMLKRLPAEVRESMLEHFNIVALDGMQSKHFAAAKNGLLKRIREIGGSAA